MDEVRLVVRGGLPNLLTLETVLFHTQAKIMGINSSPFFLGFYLMPITAMGHSVVLIRNKNKSFYLYIWNISKYVYIFCIFIHTVYVSHTYRELMINSCTILGTDAFSIHAVTYKSPPQATRNGLNYNDRSMGWPWMESNMVRPDICLCYPLESWMFL